MTYGCYGIYSFELSIPKKFYFVWGAVKSVKYSYKNSRSLVYENQHIGILCAFFCHFPDRVHKCLRRHDVSEGAKVLPNVSKGMLHRLPY